MRYATTTDGTAAGVITGLFAGPQPFPTLQVPDNAGLGWTQINEVWQKGAALLAKEADDSDRTAKRGNLNAAMVATLRQWGTDAAGTTATSGNAVAVLNTMLAHFAVAFPRMADMIEAQRLDQ